MQFLVLLLFLVGCSSVSNDTPQSPSEPVVTTDVPFWEVQQSGGEATSKDKFATSHAFSYPMPNLNEKEMETHLSGDPEFERQFTNSGLGPVQNNTSCIGCHNRDGRGSLPTGLNDKEWKKIGVNEAIFLRISIESPEILGAPKNAQNKFGAPVPVPGHSAQLFHTGNYFLRSDFPGEGLASVYIKLQKSEFQYPDGRIVELSKPVFEVRNPYDQWIDQVTGQKRSRLFESDVRFSPRMGMPMFGLGLLESIPEEDLLSNAGVDRSAEGVFGKPNRVFDVIKYNQGNIYPVSLGRFGLKANTPSVAQQSLGALNGDIGVTNYLFPIESIFGTPLYDSYLAQNSGLAGKIEVDDETADALVFYSSTLAVPARRNVNDPEVIAGGKLFQKVSCTSCHVPSWKTGDAKIQALAHQKITPYTDLLLHDMGEGLADDRQDFEADGRQWKTRPLWGIGLTKVVNPRAGFLHDGRANTIEEAILWHDGEARYSRDRFVNLSSTERAQLIKFIESL